MPYETDLIKPWLSIPGIIQGGQQGDPNKISIGSLQLAGYAGYAKFKYFSKDAAGKQAYKDVSVSILFWGIAYISVLRTLLGGISNGGEKFSAASASWQYANLRLSGAAVDARDWSGDAADAYDARNTEQMTRTSTMQEIDSKVAAILARELEQLKYTKLQLDYETAILIAMVPICYALGKSNPAASTVLQLSVTIPAVVAASGAILDMVGNSNMNSMNLGYQKQAYQDIASGAATTLEALNNSTVPTSNVTPTPKTTVRNFDSLNTVTPVPVGSDRSMPPDMVTPETMSLSPDERPTPPIATTTSTGGGLGFEDASPPAPSEDRPTEPDVTPTSTVPTMGQMTSRAPQASTRAGQFSRDTATQMRLANQTLGTVQQMGSMAPSGPPLPGAAAGAGNGERAPIDVLADSTEQTQEPSPTERTL